MLCFAIAGGKGGGGERAEEFKLHCYQREAALEVECGMHVRPHQKSGVKLPGFIDAIKPTLLDHHQFSKLNPGQLMGIRHIHHSFIDTSLLMYLVCNIGAILASS